MTEEACVPSEVKPKRKSPRRALEFRARIKELALAGKTPIQTAKITGRTKQAVFLHLKNLVADGELRPDQTNYERAGPSEERTRYKIIERTLHELSFYVKQRLVPTARKMGYRLIELAVAAKKAGHDVDELGLPDLPDPTDANYHREKKLFFDRFYGDSAEARKGVDSTYTKKTYLPKLPINCFRDDLRETIGETDIDVEPQDPTPHEPPDDPIEVTLNAIKKCKDEILNYDGSCYEGDKGVDPGRWYGQPNYVEVWCESETIQPDLWKFQDGRKNKVATMRGFPSTPCIYDNCTRLKQVAEDHDYIEKIIILYFGDSDEAGNKIAANVKAALKWYSDGSSEDLCIPIEVEFRRIAITPEQVKKYKLTGYQLEAFMTTEKRLEIFKKIILDAIDECWNEDTWLDNCPPEEYDYEANGEEQPEDIDVDNEFYEDTDVTIREKMVQMATEAFKSGWEKE